MKANFTYVRERVCGTLFVGILVILRWYFARWGRLWIPNWGEVGTGTRKLFPDSQFILQIFPQWMNQAFLGEMPSYPPHNWCMYYCSSLEKKSGRILYKMPKVLYIWGIIVEYLQFENCYFLISSIFIIKIVDIFTKIQILIPTHSL